MKIKQHCKELNYVDIKFQTSPNIILKAGAHEHIGEIVRGIGEKALLLHGKSLNEVYKESMVRSLNENKITVVPFENESGEPSVEMVDNVVKAINAHNCDFIIAVGGGSVIDAGKAAAGLAVNGGNTVEYLEGVGTGRKIVNTPIPFVAVPTTHGTGAELTKNGVISSQTDKYKKSIRDDRLMAKVVIVDAELMVSLPKKQTAFCSMDAITQLIEAYTCCKSNIMTDALCISGLHAAAESIYEAYDNGDNIQAREKMAYASMISGICLANAGLGAVHGLAPALGITYGIPHGESCALLLDHVMRYNIPYCTEKYAEIGRILKGGDYADDFEAAYAGADFITELKKHMGIPNNLKSIGINDNDIEQIIQRISTNSMNANPVKMNNDEIAAFLKQLY